MNEIRYFLFLAGCFLLAFPLEGKADVQRNFKRDVLTVEVRNPLSDKASEKLYEMIAFAKEKCIPPHHSVGDLYISGIVQAGGGKRAQRLAMLRARKIENFFKEHELSNFQFNVVTEPAISLGFDVAGMTSILLKTPKAVYVELIC